LVFRFLSQQGIFHQSSSSLALTESIRSAKFLVFSRKVKSFSAKKIIFIQNFGYFLTQTNKDKCLPFFKKFLDFLGKPSSECLSFQRDGRWSIKQS
jgi:hypothetical protein